MESAACALAQVAGARGGRRFAAPTDDRAGDGAFACRCLRPRDGGVARSLALLPGAIAVNLRQPRRNQEGIALVLVLWLTILLTVIASGFAYSMRSEALAARNAISVAQARALADGAVTRATFEMMRPRVTGETWVSDGSVHYWSEDGASIAANVVDESGKIDLNAASDAVLKSLLQTAGGVDADTAARLVDA